MRPNSTTCRISIRAGRHLRSTSILAQHRLLAADAGVGVLPCFIGDADPRWCALPAHAIRRSFWLVTHRDTRNLQRIRLVTDWLASIVDKRRWQLPPG
jgi:DNA-binding transcriptional LysR family regulator